MAFCVFDTDTDVNKNKQIKKILNKSDKISIITSSPCIEVWFYLHFKDWEKYVTSNQIVKELKKIFPGYTKGGLIPSEIFENEEVAIKRAKKLEERHLKNKINIDSVEANPHSSIYKIIDIFMYISFFVYIFLIFTKNIYIYILYSSTIVSKNNKR